MALLYFWRGDNYARDLDEGVGFHLNQSSARLHSIGVGDSLWAFTRAPDGTYALACELVITAKTRNPEGFHYGPYRVWGSLTDSRYFHVPDAGVEDVLRSLSLSLGSQPLGRYFQGRAAVRPITRADHQALAAFAAALPLEPRVHGWRTPRSQWELALEQACLAGDSEVADALVQQDSNGLSPERRQSLVRQVFQRNRALVVALRDRYSGRCQVCAWDPRRLYNADACEGHHIQWLSRGGPDNEQNLALLCPNHHRLIHALDAPLDYVEKAFILPGQRLSLQLNSHLRS
jgi:5-methylcytosine-specific restriction protein A